MKKLFLFLFGFALSIGAAQATKWTVQVADFSFTPANVTAKVGDTVMWVWMGGSHTTTSTSVPTGAGTWDSPMTSTATTFQYKITVAGTYNYVCTPHAPGMAGTINATPSTGVPEPGKMALRISPNPADQSVIVDLAGRNEGSDLNMYDIQGRIVYKGRVEAGKSLRIPTADIPTGMYQVAIMVDGMRQTSPIIIRH